MAGYIFLGIGFGLLLDSKGYGILWSAGMSTFIYAGSLEYLCIDLMSSGADLFTTALTALMVNARHLFYGIAMLGKYKETGKYKPYLIFGLTDETFSILCNENKDYNQKEKVRYYFYLTLFDHFYWVFGSALGSAAAFVLTINLEGIDFALTALFITIATDQWLNNSNHLPAVTGAAASLLCLLFLGADRYLIPAMIMIIVLLLLPYERKGAD